jgi:hypothetical protein
VKEIERGRVDTSSGFEKMGRGLVLAVGWKCSPGPLTLFPFSFSISFLFSYSFITFANLVQIDSNQFVKFSKIQLIILNQQRISFQDQNKFSIKTKH